MKRFIFAAILAAGLVVGFVSHSSAYQEYDYVLVYQQPCSRNPRMSVTEIKVIADLVTGVEYIVTDSGICPRYDANGELFTADKEE